jgi:hypothetical protein
MPPGEPPMDPHCADSPVKPSTASGSGRLRWQLCRLGASDARRLAVAVRRFGVRIQRTKTEERHDARRCKPSKIRRSVV